MATSYLLLRLFSHTFHITNTLNLLYTSRCCTQFDPFSSVHNVLFEFGLDRFRSGPSRRARLHFGRSFGSRLGTAHAPPTDIRPLQINPADVRSTHRASDKDDFALTNFYLTYDFV